MNDDDDEPRPLTQPEMTARVFDHLMGLVRIWKDAAKGDTRDRLEGLVYSILVMLDGCACDMPGFELYPSPHKDDARHYRERGENWWPSDVTVHGTSMLHEQWIEYLRAR